MVARKTSNLMLYSILLSNIPVYALAVEEKVAASKEAETLAYSGLMQMTLGLLVVLAMIFGFAWLLRRFGRYQGLANGSLKTLGGLPLGTRERLVLVQVGGKQLLLGVTPHSIQTLHVLDENIMLGGSRDKSNPSGSFSDRLAYMMSKGK